jgi:hypothetical protein
LVSEPRTVRLKVGGLWYSTSKTSVQSQDFMSSAGRWPVVRVLERQAQKWAHVTRNKTTRTIKLKTNNIWQVEPGTNSSLITNRCHLLWQMRNFECRVFFLFLIRMERDCADENFGHSRKFRRCFDKHVTGQVKTTFETSRRFTRNFIALGMHASTCLLVLLILIS